MDVLRLGVSVLRQLLHSCALWFLANFVVARRNSDVSQHGAVSCRVKEKHKGKRKKTKKRRGERNGVERTTSMKKQSSLSVGYQDDEWFPVSMLVPLRWVSC